MYETHSTCLPLNFVTFKRTVSFAQVVYRQIEWKVYLRIWLYMWIWKRAVTGYFKTESCVWRRIKLNYEKSCSWNLVTRQVPSRAMFLNFNTDRALFTNCIEEYTKHYNFRNVLRSQITLAWWILMLTTYY